MLLIKVFLYPILIWLAVYTVFKVIEIFIHYLEYLRLKKEGVVFLGD